MSKKLTINAAEDAVTIETATVGDMLTTLISTDTVLTGTYGLVQKLGLLGGGMVISNKMHSNEFFNFGTNRIV